VPHDGIALHLVDRFAESLVIAALLGELGLVLANVFARAWLHHSFLWADEVARLTLATLAFVGGAVAYRRRDHACVRIVLKFFPKRTQDILFALADVVVLFVAGLTGVASFEFIASSWNERTPVLQLPAAVIAIPLPAGMVLIALFAMVHLWREHGKTAVGAAAVFALVVAAALVTRQVWLPWFAGDTAISATLALFFAAILAGVPVGFVLLLATATYI
jgi:TRAP-type C4-dicarboxylate transport system permease small subunit